MITENPVLKVCFDGGEFCLRVCFMVGKLVLRVCVDGGKACFGCVF